MMDDKKFTADNITIKKSDRLICQNIEDGSIMLNMKDENYYGLDKVGTRFWEILLNTLSVRDAFDQLLEEYDVDAQTLEKDLRDFIGKLEKHGLVSITAIK